MDTILVKLAVAGFMFASCSAIAIDMPTAGKNKCGACHTINDSTVGPAWKAVAAKYKGKSDAEKILISNITKGGEFGWNQGKMRPRGFNANDKQIASLARFIAVDLNK